jgi:hypothetical protein
VLHRDWWGRGLATELASAWLTFGFTSLGLDRIIAVADSFDAMTTERPYQKAMSFEAALARLNELKGSGFDEQIVESFNRAYRSGEFTPRPQPAAPREVPVPSAV